MGIATTTLTTAFEGWFGVLINQAIYWFTYALPYLVGIAVLYFLYRLARSAFRL